MIFNIFIKVIHAAKTLHCNKTLQVLQGSNLGKSYFEAEATLAIWQKHK